MTAQARPFIPSGVADRREHQAHLHLPGRPREAPRGARGDGHRPPPEIAQRIHDAKEHGDLTENAEYEDAKNEQAFVEGRIQTLEALIKNATLIDETTRRPRPDRLDREGRRRRRQPRRSRSSARPRPSPPTAGSPTSRRSGRALLGRKKGDKVTVKVPPGDFAYKIVEISYPRGRPPAIPPADAPGLERGPPGTAADVDWADELAASVEGPAGRQRLEDAVRHGPRRQPARARSSST